MVERLETGDKAETGAKERRTRSTIEFPYNDLSVAMEVTEAIYRNAGAGSCTIDQLAAWMKHETVESGAFRLKVSATRTFGLIQVNDRSISATALGREALNPSTAQNAKVQAFLHVPLYNVLYEKYRGGLLPPNVGLERQIAELGVSPKQVDRARQAFQRSALQAGFFQHGRDRLVLPAGTATVPSEKSAVPQDQDQKAAKGGGGSRGGGDDSDLHPFILGLLKTLPAPGTQWPEDKRKQWLQAAENIFSLIYEQ